MSILRANLGVVETTVAGVSFYFGKKYLFENSSPPRIVWVPTSDPIGRAEAVTAPDYPYKAVRTRQAMLDAHIWGVSYDQAEAMLHNLVSALAVNFSAVCQIGQAQWLEDGQAAWFTLGWATILPIGFSIPVLDEQIAIPTTPEEASEQPEPKNTTVVTVVSGTPAVDEANLTHGSKTWDKDPTTP